MKIYKIGLNVEPSQGLLQPKWHCEVPKDYREKVSKKINESVGQ